MAIFAAGGSTPTRCAHVSCRGAHAHCSRWHTRLQGPGGGWEAGRAFAAQVQSIASSFGKSLSISDAKTQLSSALQEVASAYEKSLAPIDCS